MEGGRSKESDPVPAASSPTFAIRPGPQGFCGFTVPAASHPQIPFGLVSSPAA